MIQKLIKKIIFGSLSFACSVVGGEALTGAELAQIENAFGITLSSNDIAQLSEIVYPTNTPVWRSDAYARIDAHRKADLDIRVFDQNGDPVEGAQVSVKLKSNQFKFGGTFSIKDFSGVTNPDMTMSVATYKQRLLTMFNAVGLNNGFKPRLDGLHEYLPDFKNWAASNDLPVRGHLLIWPGVDEVNNHLTDAVLADVRAVEAALTNGSSQATIDALRDALRTTARTEMEEWAALHDVVEWDVINEPLSNHRVQDALDDYDVMADWFKTAESNKISADCGLRINEFQIISAMSEARTPGYYTDRRDRYMTEINRLLSNSAPITGIGFQSRIKHEHRDPQLIYDRLEEWATAYPALTMAGTEFEVQSSDSTNDWKWYIYTDEERAQITEEMMTQYFSHPQVDALTAWDTIGNGDTELVDYTGTPARNGLVWYYLHRIRFNTDVTLASGLNGRTGLRAFKGDYDLTVTYNGQEFVSALTVTNDESIAVTLNSTMAGDPSTAAVIDAWSYDGLSNGAGLSSAVSTGLVGGVSTPDYSLASVQNETVRWQSDGMTDSLYRNIVPSSSAGVSNGLYQISLDFLDADFSASAAVSNGSGRVVLGVRSDAAGDVNFRLVFDSGGGSAPEFRLEATDDLGSNQELATFFGTTLDHLSVRAVYDFDNAGSTGSYKVYCRLNGGSEIASYTAGQLPPGFTLDQLRLIVQTYNGGVNWQAGDRVYTDNMVLRSLGEPPPPPTVVALEDWQMNEAAGANLSGLVNSAGSAVWSGDKENVQTDGSGNLLFSVGANSSDNLYRNSTLTQNGVTNGVYQLSFAFPSATLAGGDAAGASVGFGLRDETTSSDLFLIRLQRQNSELRLQTRIGTTNTDIYDFNATSLPGALAIRAVFDLDADLMDLYYSIDGGAEVSETDIVINDGVMDAVRMACSLNNVDFGAADFVAVDYLTLSRINESVVSPVVFYQSWLNNFPALGVRTNLTDNPDGDAFDNLAEYGLGGDPTLADFVNVPVLQQGSGNSLIYIHVQRSDAAERGLSYYLELTPDLAAPAWTNGGYTVLGTNIGYAAGFDAVTNLIPTGAEASQIIRLRVGINYP
ncbi:endo-1,4-beta-xylanase [Tichowtungia aerotolerans]|uniref:endo-1,4-beta-xylanase n=1 Tax=Tichowtungia aerotolerans TaxID=2697043 RepID=A0A6P1MDA5_9BACT|nr:endo-1,4-beta-xylanase [Tichowtungia aerotolerans]QHI69085.1 hypothetical protein GT409_06370 [Tichowtungia aerotolerans]